MDLQKNSKLKLVVFDGPKASGKGTYLSAVSEYAKSKGYCIFNNRAREHESVLKKYHKKFSAMHYDIPNDQKMHCFKCGEFIQLVSIFMMGQPTILDRSWISEFVYGRSRRGYEFPVKELEEMVAELFDYKIFIFLPKFGELMSRQQQRDGELDRPYKMIYNTFKYYSAFTELNHIILDTSDKEKTIDIIRREI